MGELLETANKKRINDHLFLLLVLLNIVDFISTYVGINVYGKTEQNPIMGYAIEWMGTVWAVLLVKAIVFAHIYYHYYYTEKGMAHWLERRTTILLILFNVLFSAVVLNNVIRIGMM